MQLSNKQKLHMGRPLKITWAIVFCIHRQKWLSIWKCSVWKYPLHILIPLAILFEMEIPLGEVTYYSNMLTSYQISFLLSKGELWEKAVKIRTPERRKEQKQNVKENGVHIGLELQLVTSRSGPGVWLADTGTSLMITLTRTWCCAFQQLTNILTTLK